MLSNKLRIVLLISAFVGAISALIGFLFAVILDTTPGPAMVIVATFIYLMVALFAPEKGLVPSWYRTKKQRSKIIREDILKHLSKFPASTEDQLSLALGMTLSTVKSQTTAMKQSGLLHAGKELKLTTEGAIIVEDLVRAHRLWESYQSESMGLKTEQIHDDAERLEHHLTPDFIDELDKKLGYPKLDPHGSPIPQKATGEILADCPINKSFLISPHQESEKIEALLWELGISSLSSVKIIKKDKNVIQIESGGKRLKINLQSARKIKITAVLPAETN